VCPTRTLSHCFLRTATSDVQDALSLLGTPRAGAPRSSAGIEFSASDVSISPLTGLPFSRAFFPPEVRRTSYFSTSAPSPPLFRRRKNFPQLETPLVVGSLGGGGPPLGGVECSDQTILPFCLVRISGSGSEHVTSIRIFDCVPSLLRYFFHMSFCPDIFTLHPG